jgi:hypothetical protein
MVLRRFHRTLGPLLLLAAAGFLLSLLLLILKSEPEGRLAFAGFTNVAGVNRALFLLAPRKQEDSRWFNMTSTDQQVCRLTYLEARGGSVQDEPVSASQDYAPNGWWRWSVPVPESATSICFAVEQRIRRGKIDPASLQGPGAPKVLYVLPWGRTERFRSEIVSVTNASPAARPLR